MPNLIGDALRWHATYTPHKTAVVSQGGRLNYGDLWLRVVRLANGLTSLGVGPNDRIALLLHNGAPYLELYHAAALIGAAVVPLNYRFVESEIEYVVNHSQARVLVFDAAYATTVDSCRSRFTVQNLSLVVECGSHGIEHPLAWAQSYESIIDLSLAPDWTTPADPNACYFQGYTSGTTGFPKGCVNPHRSFADCLRRLRIIYGISPSDVELVAAPLFHEAPALFALTQMFCGGTVIVTGDGAPSNIFSLIETEHVTWAFMVPTMWSAVVMSDVASQYDLSSMRILISGGSPLHTHTKQALLEKLPNAGLNEFYGGTEVGLVTNLGPEDQQRKVRSVGKPVMGMYVELLDELGNRVPQGEIGEIYIGGSLLIREYFNNIEATTAARDKRGFFTLGDMGQFDDEGYLYIVDRRKDMIISGGENIFPNDIEAALYEHPGIQMVAVVGAPDPRWGEVVVAVVVPREGAEVDEQMLIEYCKTRMASFKVPKRIDFRSGLPLSSFGKILRREIRKHYWNNQESQI